MSILHQAWVKGSETPISVVYMPPIEGKPETEGFYRARETSRDTRTKRRHVMIGDEDSGGVRVVDTRKRRVRVQSQFGQTTDQTIDNIDPRLTQDYRIPTKDIKNAEQIRQTATSKKRARIPDGSCLPAALMRPMFD